VELGRGGGEVKKYPAGPSPVPSPTGRGVVCEVTPIGLLIRFLGSFFSHRG